MSVRPSRPCPYQCRHGDSRLLWYTNAPLLTTRRLWSQSDYDAHKCEPIELLFIQNPSVACSHNHAKQSGFGFRVGPHSEKARKVGSRSYRCYQKHPQSPAVKPGGHTTLQPKKSPKPPPDPVPAPNGASPSPAFLRGRSKKKHSGWCFFLLWPRAGAQRGFSFACLSPGPQQKKKHPGWCFFFCCGPARTLTHSLRAWMAMPPPRRGGVFFFCCGPARTGVVFFFCCGPARTLTHSRWAGAISARPGWCFFFCCGPAGSF